jgi:hypothetical protein
LDELGVRYDRPGVPDCHFVAAVLFICVVFCVTGSLTGGLRDHGLNLSAIYAAAGAVCEAVGAQGRKRRVKCLIVGVTVALLTLFGGGGADSRSISISQQLLAPYGQRAKADRASLFGVVLWWAVAGGISGYVGGALTALGGRALVWLVGSLSKTAKNLGASDE